MALAFQQRIYWRINDVGNVKWNSGVNAVGRLRPFQQRRGQKKSDDINNDEGYQNDRRIKWDQGDACTIIY